MSETPYNPEGSREIELNEEYLTELSGSLARMVLEDEHRFNSPDSIVSRRARQEGSVRDAAIITWYPEGSEGYEKMHLIARIRFETLDGDDPVFTETLEISREPGNCFSQMYLNGLWHRTKLTDSGAKDVSEKLRALSPFVPEEPI